MRILSILRFIIWEGLGVFILRKMIFGITAEQSAVFPKRKLIGSLIVQSFVLLLVETSRCIDTLRNLALVSVAQCTFFQWLKGLCPFCFCCRRNCFSFLNLRRRIFQPDDLTFGSALLFHPFCIAWYYLPLLFRSAHLFFALPFIALPVTVLFSLCFHQGVLVGSMTVCFILWFATLHNRSISCYSIACGLHVRFVPYSDRWSDAFCLLGFDWRGLRLSASKHWCIHQHL